MVSNQNITCLIVEMEIKVNFTYIALGEILDFRVVNFPFYAVT